MALDNHFEKGTFEPIVEGESEINFADKYLREVHFKQREKTVQSPWGRPYVSTCLMCLKTTGRPVFLGRSE